MCAGYFLVLLDVAIAATLALIPARTEQRTG
jgi:hypothetical protein